MTKFLAAFGLLLIGVSVFLALYNPNEGVPQHKFYALLTAEAAPQSVTATRLQGLVVYHAPYGDLSIPTRCGPVGVGYVSTWTRNGQVISSSEQPNPDNSAANYQNNSAVGSGIGMFSSYLSLGKPLRYWDRKWGPTPPNTSWTTGNKMCRYPGVAWVGPPAITATSYTQGIVLLHGYMQVDYHWKFRVRSFTLDAKVRVGRTDRAPAFPPDTYLKEPEFGATFQSIGAHAISSPCHTYTQLWNPMRRTGRCESLESGTVGIGGIRIHVNLSGIRKYAADAANWSQAGDQWCPGWTGNRIHPNTEFTAWRYHGLDAPMDSTAALFKFQEGCVSGLDFTWGYRQPVGVHTYYFHMTIDP